MDGKRISSSSEDIDPIDTSDEVIEYSRLVRSAHFFPGDKFKREQYSEPDDDLTIERGRNRVQSQTPPRAGGSGFKPKDCELTAEEKAEKLIMDAEAAKAKLFAPQGKQKHSSRGNIDRADYRFTAEIDDDYSVIGSHIDASVKAKIENGEYVDFGCLLPKDKVNTSREDDDRYELTVKNGKTFWTPVNESVSITSFSHWEQALRIFSNIYNHKYPEKSTELIQYNHIIHSVSSIYIWDNVYAYDKDFRRHLSRHPDHPWNLILHQAWFLWLKDCIRGEGKNVFFPREQEQGGGAL